MKTKVALRILKDRPNWRSVAVTLPIKAGTPRSRKAFEDPKEIVKKWVAEIALQAGLPKKRTAVGTYPILGCYRGFVRVYAGAPTPADTAKLKLVQEIAARVTASPQFTVLTDMEFRQQLGMRYPDLNWYPNN